ncbi:MAG: hypothetical protein M3Z20_15175 [Chloroflexota bacterium]|nr:hypothetical protein [Chloroflexota bacterium]
MSPELVDSSGRRIQTGALLGKGGEGAVHEVVGHAGEVAKLFHAPATGDKALKLTAMVAKANPQLLTVASWPTATLHSRPQRDAVAGIVMPRMSGFAEVHHLNGPRSRIATFPHADWTFLIHTAANIARAFANLHQTGTVIGDVNDRNVLVSAQGTARLIDCDSFQISSGSRVFLCPVGVPTHTPPELQGMSLAQVRRTANHDAFGLAVLIFQLLFMGRHPYSGIYQHGDLSMENAIAEGRFAYGADAPGRLMAPPPHALPLEAVSPEVASLFLRAFVPAASGSARPSAADWTQALDRMKSSLVRCSRVPTHTFLNTLALCPWCQIEAGSGVVLFAVVVTAPVTGQSTSFRLETVWAQITAIASPGPLPAIPPQPGPTPAPRIATLRQARRKRRLMTGGIAAVVTGMLLLLQMSAGGAPILVAIVVLAGAVGWDRWQDRAWRESRSAAFSALEQVSRQRSSLEARWNTLGPGPFDEARDNLETRAQEYRDLPNLRTRELQVLERNSRAIQLQRYLDSRRIDNARISGIGPTRIATLQSFGIETAAQVNPAAIAAVPGFGPHLTRTMLDWRSSIERAFVYNAKVPVAKSDIAELDRKIAQKEARLVQELQAGPTTLQTISNRILAARSAQHAALLETERAYLQAQADYLGH